MDTSTRAQLEYNPKDMDTLFILVDIWTWRPSGVGRRVSFRKLVSDASVMKTALITGITGQDGSYLAELLLTKGYRVHGIIRRSSSFNTGRIDHIYRDRHETGVKLFLHYGDLCDGTNLISLLADIRPDEIYNLGAMSHVKVSFDLPEVRDYICGYYMYLICL